MIPGERYACQNTINRDLSVLYRSIAPVAEFRRRLKPLQRPKRLVSRSRRQPRVPENIGEATDVTKPELGIKRICSNCNLKFYDLHKSPIVCPTCKTVFVPPTLAPTKPRRLPDASTAAVQKPAITPSPPDAGSDENTDSLIKDENEEDDQIDEDFEKE